MQIRTLEQHQYRDNDLNSFQAAVSRWSELIRACHLIDGRLIKNIDINIVFGSVYISGAIYHKLGKIPEGWILCGNNSSSTIWSNSITKDSIVMASTSVTVVSILVF
jgi:hypothetical protein